jgi:adenosylhomocysteine nucleosidase
MLGIVANTKEELLFLLNKSNIINEFTYGDLSLIEAKIKSLKIIYIITGFSSTSIGFALGYTLANYHLKAIINVGTSASIDEKLKIGDIMISSQTLSYNYNYSALNCPITTTPNDNTSIFPADNELIKKTINAAKKLYLNYQVGRFGSSDIFVADCEEKEKIKNNFKIDFLDLNSSFIGSIAYKYEIPFIIIKSVSNYADNFAGEDYQNYFKIASESSNLLVYNLLLTQSPF